MVHLFEFHNFDQLGVINVNFGNYKVDIRDCRGKIPLYAKFQLHSLSRWPQMNENRLA